MTRYRTPAKDPRHTIVLGWDPPLQTYFAQVWDRKRNSEDPVLWLGTSFGEVSTCERLGQLLDPYATIPERLHAQLVRDKEPARAPGEYRGDLHTKK